MTKQKGILTSDSKLASELAYQIRATQDFNAVIYDENTDKRALCLARDLTGITQANSCPIWAKCRINPSDPNAPRIYVACLSAYNNGYLWSQFEKEHHFWSMHIDWESVARDLELSDAYYYASASESEGYGIYVFRYC